MRYAVIVLALSVSGYACASIGVTHVADATPARLNPLDGAIVIELDVPNWQEVCFRQAPAKTNMYRCVTVGDLRMVIEDKRNAGWKSFLASWGKTFAVNEPDIQ